MLKMHSHALKAKTMRAAGLRQDLTLVGQTHKSRNGAQNSYMRPRVKVIILCPSGKHDRSASHKSNGRGYGGGGQKSQQLARIIVQIRRGGMCRKTAEGWRGDLGRGDDDGNRTVDGVAATANYDRK